MSYETKDIKSQTLDEINFFFEDFPHDDQLVLRKYPDCNGFSPTFCEDDEVNLIKELRVSLERSRDVLNSNINLTSSTIKKLNEVVIKTIGDFRKARLRTH